MTATETPSRPEPNEDGNELKGNEAENQQENENTEQNEDTVAPEDGGDTSNQ